MVVQASSQIAIDTVGTMASTSSSSSAMNAAGDSATSSNNNGLLPGSGTTPAASGADGLSAGYGVSLGFNPDGSLAGTPSTPPGNPMTAAASSAAARQLPVKLVRHVHVPIACRPQGVHLLDSSCMGSR